MTKHIFKFGKIDYNGTGRKVNAVTVEVGYDGERFSASGNIWNSKKTDILCGGQCLDEINKHLFPNGIFKKIYSIWKDYHLNDCTPGTPKQMAYLKTLNRPSDAEFYTWECEQLEKANLLIDDHNGEAYKYGTKWLTTPLPKSVKKSLIGLGLEVA